MKIIMGADPAGFELKNAIKEDLLKRGYEIMDIDPDEPVLFQEAAKAVARGVQSKEPEEQKLSITPMYSVWGGFIIGNEMGREMARAWLEAEHMVGLDPEMARIVEKEFDELVEFENEMYGDTRQ
uniref:Uncharacterized protein n=1 Tax=Glossina morsitans morsitans TaxID=37546 RepID=A0A1B0FCC7_GLOMM